MQCDEIADQLAAVADGDAVLDRIERRHVERCLRCQAELVQYRKLLKAMHTMRTEVLEPAPGILSDILASIEATGERHAIRSLVTGRRAAYVGGLAVAGAGAAAGALLFAARRKQRLIAS